METQFRERMSSLTDNAPKAELLPLSQHFVDPGEDERFKHRGRCNSGNMDRSEPDEQDAFAPVIYSELIRSAMTEVRKQSLAHDWDKAEMAQIKAVNYLRDREAKLGIPFETRTQMIVTLADINIKQDKLNLANAAVCDLLKTETADNARQWTLLDMLAQIYLAQGRYEEAEEIAKQAHTGRERTLGKGHAMISQSSTLLASIYEKLGDPQSAQNFRNLHPEGQTNAANPSQTFKYIGTTRVAWNPDLTMDMDILTKDGKTLLINAIISGDEDMVAQALIGEADLERRCNQDITPLMYAIIHNQEKIAGVLLSRGANVDAKTLEWSPLHKACDQNDKAIVELLLEHDANTESRAPRKFSLAKTLAAQNRSTSDAMTHLDLDSQSEEEESATHSHVGWTPLLRAASRGQADITRLLLEHGAAIEARDPRGHTALVCAVENYHYETVAHLLARGANANVLDSIGWSPLHRVQERRGADSLRIATALLTLPSPRADLDAKCGKGMTPLHHAAERDNEAMMRLLIQHGANLAAADNSRRTPLHTAIEARRENMVHVLLQHGADTALRDIRGHDGLSAAKVCVRRSPEIINLLERDRQRKQQERESSPSLPLRPNSKDKNAATNGQAERKEIIPLGASGGGGSTSSSLPRTDSLAQRSSSSNHATLSNGHLDLPNHHPQSHHHSTSSSSAALGGGGNPSSSSSTSSFSRSKSKSKKEPKGDGSTMLSEQEIESLGMLGIAAKGSGLSSAAAANRPRDTRPDLPSSGMGMGMGMGLFGKMRKKGSRGEKERKGDSKIEGGEVVGKKEGRGSVGSGSTGTTSVRKGEEDQDGNGRAGSGSGTGSGSVLGGGKGNVLHKKSESSNRGDAAAAAAVGIGGEGGGDRGKGERWWVRMGARGQEENKH